MITKENNAPYQDTHRFNKEGNPKILQLNRVYKPINLIIENGHWIRGDLSLGLNSSGPTCTRPSQALTRLDLLKS